ncbi:MAG: hypothetical protein ACI303_08570 [Lepagella sp.]
MSLVSCGGAKEAANDSDTVVTTDSPATVEAVASDSPASDSPASDSPASEVATTEAAQ